MRKIEHKKQILFNLISIYVKVEMESLKTVEEVEEAIEEVKQYIEEHDMWHYFNNRDFKQNISWE